MFSLTSAAGRRVKMLVGFSKKNEQEFCAHLLFVDCCHDRSAGSLEQATGSAAYFSLYAHPDHSRVFPAYAHREYGRGLQFVCRLAGAMEDGDADCVFGGGAGGGIAFALEEQPGPRG